MSFFFVYKKIFSQNSDQIVAIISHMLQNFSSNDDKCLKIFIRDLPQNAIRVTVIINRVFRWVKFSFFFVYNLHLWIFVSAQNILKIYFWMLNLCNFIPDARGYTLNVYVNKILFIKLCWSLFFWLLYNTLWLKVSLIVAKLKPNKIKGLCAVWHKLFHNLKLSSMQSFD